MKKKKIFSQAVLITILGAALVIVLIPIFWAISMSFDDRWKYNRDYAMHDPYGIYLDAV